MPDTFRVRLAEKRLESLARNLMRRDFFDVLRSLMQAGERRSR